MAQSRSWNAHFALCVACCLTLVVTLGCAGGPPDRARPKKKGPLMHYQMARMYFEQGKVAQALQEIDRSLALDDSLPQTHFYKGYIYWTMERWQEAAEAFERAIALHPFYTDARMYIATCYENLGHPERALEQLAEAERDRTYPYPEKIHLNRGLILERRGRLEEGLAELRRAVEIRPRYYRAHFEMARLFEKLGRFPDALEAYRTARPGYEKDAEFHYRFGAALFRADRRDEASIELRKAIELAPGSETAAKAQDLLGVLG